MADFSGPYTPNGITTTFPFTFDAVSELGVHPVRRSALGVDTPLTNYTVDLSQTGGSVIFATAPATGDPIYILSLADLIQTPTTFLDTRFNTVGANSIQTNVFARVAYLTEATQIVITGYNNIFSTYPWAAELGLYVNGVYQTVSFGANGTESVTVDLVAGLKKIEIVNGDQSATQGTYLVSVSGNQPLTPLDDSKGSRLLFYGDSIASGQAAHFPTGMGYIPLVRQVAPVSVGAEAYGGRSLFTDCSDSTARAAFVAKIVAWNPATLWLAIGTNDYGLNTWSAASFGTAYAALLDDLHTALPSLVIYAQTPTLRTTETANGSGSTLGNYRTQITTAQSTRSAYVRLVDGTTILTTADLSDGLHPTTAGHAKFASFIENVLGYASGGTTAASIINSANTTVTQPTAGTFRVTKSGGTGGFDGSAYGTTPLDGDFTLKITPQQFVQDALAGVSPNPTDGINYTDIAFAIYFSGGGSVSCFAKGENLGTSATNYVALTPAWIGRRNGVLSARFGASFDSAEVIATLRSDARYYVDTSLATAGKYIDLALTTSASSAAAADPNAGATTRDAASALVAAASARKDAVSAAASKIAAALSELNAASSATGSAASAALATASYNAIAAAIAAGGLNNATIAASTRGILAGLNTATGLPAYHDGSNWEMVAYSGVSSLVTADTPQGIYVRSTFDTSKAWVRKVDFFVNPAWWGFAVANTASANSDAWEAMLVTLSARAVNVSSGSGGIDPVRFGLGTFAMARTPEVAIGTMLIEGAGSGMASARQTLLTFPTGVTGFRIQTSTTSGASTHDGSSHASGQGSIIRNIALKGAYGTTLIEAEAHGIHMRARATIEDVWIQQFEGDGIYILANSANGENANGWIVSRAYLNNNRQGMWVSGSDANAGKATMVDAESNRRWGILDRSFLGNNYDSCQAAGNGVRTDNNGTTIPCTICSYSGNRYGVIVGQEAGASTNAPSGTTADNTWWYYISAGAPSTSKPAWVSGILTDSGGSYAATGSSAQTVWTGCYHESGQGVAQFMTLSGVASRALVQGGTVTLAANFRGGVVLALGVGQLQTGAALFSNPADTNRIVDFVPGSGIFQRYYDATDLPSRASWAMNSSDLLHYYSTSATVYVRYTGPNTAQQFGRGAAVGAGFTYIPNFAFGSSPTNGRVMTNGTAAPTTGAHGRGEIVWNMNMTVGSPIGWACTVAGTPGTWVAMANL